MLTKIKTRTVMALSAAALWGCGSNGPTATTLPVDAQGDVAMSPDATTQPDVAAQPDTSFEDRVMQDLMVPADMAAAADVAPTDVPVAVDLGGDSMADVLLADASAGPYPAGPYGNRVGNVIANLSWEGYVNPRGGAISTTRTYGPTSLQAMRGSGRGYALVHVAEFY